MTHVGSWTGCDSRQINDLHLKVIPLTPGSRYLFDWNFSTALCLINPASSSDTGANLHFSGRFHSLVCRQQHLVIEDVSKPLLILSSDLLITYHLSLRYPRSIEFDLMHAHCFFSGHARPLFARTRIRAPFTNSNVTEKSMRIA